MATPRVFVSSTCYDLKYIRDNLRYFITTLGHEPILSEDGAVFFDPTSHTHDSCLNEIPNCQLFVLIIGGRYGGKFQDSEDSITNMEYREAIKNKIPVFTLVESGVLHDHHTYLTNKKNKDIDLTKFNFPSFDSIKIFEFIDEVRKASSNNALVPFRDFNDIECYLRKQWAGMMYKFLTETSAAQKVQDTLNTLKEMNEKIEFLSSSLFNQIADPKTKNIAQVISHLKNSSFVKITQKFPWLPKLNLRYFLDSDSIFSYLEKFSIKLEDSVVPGGDGEKEAPGYKVKFNIPQENGKILKNFYGFNEKNPLLKSFYIYTHTYLQLDEAYKSSKKHFFEDLKLFNLKLEDIYEALNYAELFHESD